MTRLPSPLASRANPAWEKFRDSEYLRAVLIRLCETEDGWRTDPEADELIAYAQDRFGQLAVKHGLDASDAMSAAFEAMRNPSARYGRDPWGVIVTAVATTFRAWQFAEEALTSIDTARRGGLSRMRAERFSERETPIWETDPHFAVSFQPDAVPEPDGLTIREQAVQISVLFTSHGWAYPPVVMGVEMIMRKLADAGSRPAAYEALRREHRWRAITGLPAQSWTGLLRLLLGTPAGVGVSDLGKGILLRMALGETMAHLLGDQVLIAAVEQVAPPKLRRPRS